MTASEKQTIPMAERISDDGKDLTENLPETPKIGNARKVKARKQAGDGSKAQTVLIGRLRAVFADKNWVFESLLSALHGASISADESKRTADFLRAAYRGKWQGLIDSNDALLQWAEIARALKTSGAFAK